MKVSGKQVLLDPSHGQWPDPSTAVSFCPRAICNLGRTGTCFHTEKRFLEGKKRLGNAATATLP